MNMTTVPSNQLKAMQHQLAAQELVIQQLRDALEKITQFASVQICSHDETYRGGNIWEICSQCGAKWADGEGGKPEFVEPKQITEAIKALAIPTSTVHLEAIESLEHQLATVIAQRDLLGKILSCQVKLNESEACLVYQDCYEALASLKGE